jgi:hypothetical protein
MHSVLFAAHWTGTVDSSGFNYPCLRLFLARCGFVAEGAFGLVMTAGLLLALSGPARWVI